jgi:hypothetical protein
MCEQAILQKAKVIAASEVRIRDLLNHVIPEFARRRLPEGGGTQLRRHELEISCVCKKALLRRLDHWTTAAFIDGSQTLNEYIA